MLWIWEKKETPWQQHGSTLKREESVEVWPEMTYIMKVIGHAGISIDLTPSQLRWMQGARNLINIWYAGCKVRR
jgi:hypothetical protein